MSTFLGRAGFVLVLIAAVGIFVSDLPTDVRSRANTVSAVVASGRTTACGVRYRVARGDTLYEIAMRAYGEGDYHGIFEANRDILSRADRVKVGDRLLIPCLYGGHVASRDAEAIADALGTGVIEIASLDATMPIDELAPKASTNAARASLAVADDDIRFVTGPDFAPFADPMLPEGGMIPEIVRLALSRSAPELKVGIVVVPDWTAHPGLLETQGFDLGLPWYRPDCARLERLTPAMQRRCVAFDFSDPVFSLPIAYYVRAGDPLTAATDYSQLAGLRICRPANHFTFDLDQEGLVGPGARLSFPHDAATCFDRLARGKVDVVTLARLAAEGEIGRPSREGQVAEIPALASVQTLHVVAPKSAPAGRENLDRVNAGLAELRKSGRWAEVVARHLDAIGVSLR